MAFYTFAFLLKHAYIKKKERNAHEILMSGIFIVQ